MSTDIRTMTRQIIRRVAEERGIPLPEMNDDTEIVDELGFSSLMVATLIANLEEAFGVDPFQDEDVMITDIRTVKDLCDAYAGAAAPHAA